MLGGGIAGTVVPEVVSGWWGGGFDNRDFAAVAPQQPGFYQTKPGQEGFVRTERHQITPPAELGRIPEEDREFARTLGDYGPHPGWLRTPAAGRWNPLWHEDWVVQGRINNQYEWDFLTPHGAVEDAMLYRANLTRAPTGLVAHTIPTVRPHPVQKMEAGEKRIWNR